MLQEQVEMTQVLVRQLYHWWVVNLNVFVNNLLSWPGRWNFPDNWKYRMFKQSLIDAVWVAYLVYQVLQNHVEVVVVRISWDNGDHFGHPNFVIALYWRSNRLSEFIDLDFKFFQFFFKFNFFLLQSFNASVAMKEPPAHDSFDFWFNHTHFVELFVSCSDHLSIPDWE